MHQTPRARRITGAHVALFALTLVALPAAAQPDSNYEVVLRDGTSVAAATRPLIAMGKVSFLNAENRSVTLPVQAVDVDATRSKLGSSQSRSRTWTDRSLAKVKGNIQVVGESESAAGGEDGEGDVATPTSDAALEDMTQAERLRYEISTLNDKMKPLAPKDRQRTLLMLRQMELQQELSRILRPPVSS